MSEKEMNGAAVAEADELVPAEEAVEVEMEGEEQADAGPVDVGEVDPAGAPEAAETQPAPSPTPMDEAKEAFIAGVREKEAACQRLHAQVEVCKEDLKEAKERYEVAISDLRQMIRQGPERQQTLPFKDQDGEETEGGASENADTSTMTEADSPEDEDDSWRGVSLTELSIPSKILDYLGDAKIYTLGELSDYTADGADLTLIKGVGEKAAEKINGATEKFWAEQKEKKQTEAASEE